jgi:hypothetical protein
MLTRIRFERRVQDVGFNGDDVVSVVLDPGWFSDSRHPSSVKAILSVFGPVLEEHDLFAESLSLIDAWAGTIQLADRIIVEGVPYWPRLREAMWHWMHERLLWRYAFENLGAGRSTSIVLPSNESAALDVAAALGCLVEVVGPPVVKPSLRSRAVRLVPAPLRRSYRHVRPHAETVRVERKVAARHARAESLEVRLDRPEAIGPDRVVLLSMPSSYQRIGIGNDQVPEDTYLGTAVPPLLAAGLDSIVIGCGINRDAVEHWWPLLAGNENLLPSYAVRSRWARPSDTDRAMADVAIALADLDDLSRFPLRAGGTDLVNPFLRALRDTAQRTILGDVLELASVERMVRELVPRAILMTHEGHRTPWLVACREAGIPTFAVQHGVLYPAHPGYPDRRDARHPLPTCTFVYGDFERTALEEMGYDRGEIVVSGSPRLDLDKVPVDDATAASERAAIRKQLGVAPGHRLLVVSTGYLEFMRRAQLAYMLMKLLGGPVPGVHVVFKQHPGEGDEGPYRAILEGLARAGGYDPPPISVVRDIDLYGLLRASDAHLGQLSTVLSDAVAVGTCNLIADVECSRAPLDYVHAGVAWPVRDVAGLNAALRDLPTPSPRARRAFLDEHFRPGHAGERIAAAILAEVA